MAPRRIAAVSSRFAGAQTIDHAETLLVELLEFAHPADATVSRYFRRHAALGSTARGLVADAVYAVLRRRSVYGAIAGRGPGRLSRRLVLLACVDLHIDVARALRDAHERAWLEGAARTDLGGLPALVRSNLPAWLWQRLSGRLGIGPALALTGALDEPAPLDLRVNRLKADRDAVLARLQAEQPSWQPRATPLSPDGIRIDGKPPIQAHALFIDGTLEVQDEGSQLLAQIVGARRGEMVVDFCAGAGGKTLALGAIMRSTGRLYAFDVSAKRLERFGPRLRRSGLSNVHPVVIAGEHDVRVRRLAGKIDRVLVDAPCSGTGTLRRNPDLKWRQHEAALAELAVKQGSILAAASKLVKPGGRLVYATCSLLDEENGAIADAFGDAHPAFARVPVDQELARLKIGLDTGQDLVLSPLEHHTDGFYAAVFERRADDRAA